MELKPIDIAFVRSSKYAKVLRIADAKFESAKQFNGLVDTEAEFVYAAKLLGKETTNAKEAELYIKNLIEIEYISKTNSLRSGMSDLGSAKKDGQAKVGSDWLGLFKCVDGKNGLNCDREIYNLSFGATGLH